MHLCVHVCMFGCGDGLCYAICSGFPGPCSGVFVCLQAAVVIMCCFVLKKPWRSLREFCPGPGGYQFVFLFPRRHGGFARVLFKRDDVGIQCIVLFMKPRRVLVICLRRRGHSVVVVLVVLVVQPIGPGCCWCCCCRCLVSVVVRFQSVPAWQQNISISNDFVFGAAAEVYGKSICDVLHFNLSWQVVGVVGIVCYAMCHLTLHGASGFESADLCF